HHLLLADLALKEDGFGSLLGAADAVILDEAHQIPDLATQFFGAHVSSRRIETLLKEVRSGMTSMTSPDAAGDAGRRGGAARLQAAVQGVEEAVQRVSASLPQRPGRISWTESNAAVGRCVGGLADALQELQSTLESFGEESMLTTLAERAGDLFASLERIAAIGDLEGARA